jgi:methylated-DNA-protein-cysteine methyltransferase related protein
MDSKRKSMVSSKESAARGGKAPALRAPRPESGWAHVYRLVKTMPRGRVITYGQLAKALRLPGGARTAGRAMAGCKSGMGVPWHRVLGSEGRILLRDPVAALQRRLLESEGVQFIGSRVDMHSHGWKLSRASATKKRRAKPKRRNA